MWKQGLLLLCFLVNQRVMPQASGRQAETETSELRFVGPGAASACGRDNAMLNKLPLILLDIRVFKSSGDARVWMRHLTQRVDLKCYSDVTFPKRKLSPSTGVIVQAVSLLKYSFELVSLKAHPKTLPLR